jgi:hypothetical protein
VEQLVAIVGIGVAGPPSDVPPPSESDLTPGVAEALDGLAEPDAVLV